LTVAGLTLLGGERETGAGGHLGDEVMRLLGRSVAVFVGRRAHPPRTVVAVRRVGRGGAAGGGGGVMVVMMVEMVVIPARLRSKAIVRGASGAQLGFTGVH